MCFSKDQSNNWNTNLILGLVWTHLIGNINWIGHCRRVMSCKRLSSGKFKKKKKNVVFSLYFHNFLQEKFRLQYMPLHCLKLHLWEVIQYHSNNKIKMEAHALSAGMHNYWVEYDVRYLCDVLLLCTEYLGYYSGCGLLGIVFVIKMVTHDVFEKTYSLWKAYEKHPLQLYIGPQWFPWLWQCNTIFDIQVTVHHDKFL